MIPRCILLPVLTVILATGTATAAPTQWTLVWQDDFNRENFIDQTKWTRIPRGTSDWDRHMSDNPACHAVKNGKLVLRGIKNPDADDPVKMITGGVTTKGKFEFTYGKVVIRAKLVFSVNDKPSFTYPKITTDKPGQWPFDQPFYLLIDLQLGGKWGGAIEEAQLPVQMEIDSVKVFRAANP